ncbi:MAG: PAS domain-containing protein [Aestuariivirgaceae bacterium]
MTAGASEAAFRAQLVLPEQRQLYDYWCAKRSADDLPGRRDICPTDFPRLLPYISLIDIEVEPFRFRFRLAGTRMREIYDREVTGLCLTECCWDDSKDYWTKTYIRISQTGKPAQGVIRGPSAEKDHLVQFWLRLPLAENDGRPGMLLCHDAIIPAEDMPGRVEALEPATPTALAV